MVYRSGLFTALFGCYMAGATWSCCLLGARSVYAILPCTSLQCHFMKIHILRVFSSNLLPALLAEWPGSSTCYYGNMRMELRWNWYRNNNLYTYVKKKTTIKLKQIWPPAFWNKMKKVRTNTSFHKKTQNMYFFFSFSFFLLWKVTENTLPNDDMNEIWSA